MTRRWQTSIGWVLLLGCLAAAQHWFVGRRPAVPDLRASTEFVVTHGGDVGPGSLREAIYAAVGTRARVRIRLPATRISVETPLPPLVNVAGVVIVGTAGASVLDGAALPDGPLLDLDAPDSRMDGVTVRRAPDQGVVIRQSGTRIVNSTFEQCDQGVYVADGVSDAVIANSVFEANRLGVVLSEGSQGTTVRDSRFSRHTDAGVWSVRRGGRLTTTADQLVVTGNHFETDRISAVVGNTRVRVEGNDVVAAEDAALILFGEGAVVRNNRIRSGRGVGVLVDQAHGALIDANEIDQNAAIGILVRGSGDALVRGNRLHSNGYGIAFVLGRPQTPNIGIENTLLRQQIDGVIVIGDSPVLRDNRVLRSRQAGVRLLDFYSAGGVRIPSEPLLDRNVVEGNTLDTTIRGVYRVPADPDQRDTEPDEGGAENE